MRPSRINYSGGGQYPFPKEVWALSGGWWSRPANWKSNTGVCLVGLGLFSAVLFNYSREREWRHAEPTHWIPSMLWSKREITVRDESHLLEGLPKSEHH